MRVLLTCFLVLFLTACALNEQPKPYESQASINSSLNNDINISDLRHKKDNGGLSIVQFSLVNTSSSDYDLVWRVQWYDESGFTQKQVSDKWRAIRMSAKSETTLNAISPSPKAEKFKIFIDKKDNYKNTQILN